MQYHARCLLANALCRSPSLHSFSGCYIALHPPFPNKNFTCSFSALLKHDCNHSKVTFFPFDAMRIFFVATPPFRRVAEPPPL